MQTKPTVQIKNCFIIANRLYGIVLDYPAEHIGEYSGVENGREVTTSSIVKIEGNTVETQRTIYIVQDWLKKPEQTA